MEISTRFIKVKLARAILLAAVGIFFASDIYAQRLPKNQPKYDRKRLHFGFCLGINYFDFHVQEIQDLAALEGYYSVRTETSPGYTIGIISNLRLAEYWDLRFVPAFTATERTLIFNVIEPISEDRQEVIRDVESSFIEMPLELKWKSERINNYRLYVLGGAKYNLDLASKQDVVDDRIFKIQRNDLSYEFGFGIDIYFEFFKFSPQLKASWGFADLMVQDGTFYVEGIQRLESRAILINFTFE